MREPTSRGGPVGLAAWLLLVLVLAIGCGLPSGRMATTSEGPGPTNGTADSAAAVTEEVSGSVNSVDADAGLLRLTTASGDPLLVSVDQFTEITINGTAGTLHDLQPPHGAESPAALVQDTAVEITYNPRTSVATTMRLRTGSAGSNRT